MTTTTKTSKITFAAIGLAFLVASLQTFQVVHAQTVKTSELSTSTQKKQPVDIESNTMEVINQKNQAIFTGKVVAVRGKVTLHSDKLVADFIKEKKPNGSEKTTVTFLYATGNVLIITATQRITGKWARMDVKADKAVVGGNVVVKQGDTIIKGQKLNVNLKTDHSVMTGGRVKGSFLPK